MAINLKWLENDEMVIVTEILAWKKKKKAMKEEFGCQFLNIDPGKKVFDTFEAIKEIFRKIKHLSNQLTKKSTKRFLVCRL